MKFAQFSDIELVNADSLQYIKTLPDDHIDLIATDPPYFKVKALAWDRQWQRADDYLEWLDAIFAEFWRVLKPTGSIYCFCGWHLASDIELLMRRRFKVLNHIVWAKPSGRWNQLHKESLRAYFPATERVLFAEHYQWSKSKDYKQSCNADKQSVMQQLTDYFSHARRNLGVSAKEINEATGTQMASHWFTASQWKLPSKKQYQKLQELFNTVAAKKNQSGELSRPYQQLVAERNKLNEKYKALRRYFAVSSTVSFTDAWTYPSVPYYPSKHPCEKPMKMMEHIISASSQPGQLVADFFMGSGSTIKAACKLGRRVIGVELEEERFSQTVREITQLEEERCQSR